jgi:ABC-type polar amino acid transport system ATPase subunit
VSGAPAARFDRNSHRDDVPTPQQRKSSAASGMDPIIRFQGVSKAFGATPVLRDVNLEIRQGSVSVICGPSGSGKSTLLRCVNGLERYQEGTITVMGRALDDGLLADPAFRSEIGMVFQRFSLYPHMNALANVTLALRKVRRMRAGDAETKAREMLVRVGLQDKIGSYPGQLSGGQQQRVAIARALVMDPKIMLFDEPTSALDPEMIREVLDVMRDLASTGMTMLVVTHEMGFAREAADQVVFMDEGRIVEQADSASFFTNPGSVRAKQFLENILHH